ncbi:MAG: hypothetical protein WCP28_13645 [Actinomycetes bacterium]
MPITADFDRLLSAVLGLIAVIYLARCIVGGFLYLLGRVPGAIGARSRRMADRVTPALVRRAAATILGAAVVGGTGLAGAQAAPASAPPQPSASGAQHHAVAIPDMDRGPLPSTVASVPSTVASVPPTVASVPPTSGRPATSARPTAPDQPSASGSYRVNAGDCLWDLAAEQLRARHGGTPASPLQIDKQWRRWYALNRDAIGTDPAIIVPGTRLQVPGPDRPGGGESTPRSPEDGSNRPELEGGGVR